MKAVGSRPGSSPRRKVVRIRWNCRRIAQRMEKRPSIEEGTMVLPRTRTSSVPVADVLELAFCAKEKEVYHLELHRSNVADRNDL